MRTETGRSGRGGFEDFLNSRVASTGQRRVCGGFVDTERQATGKEAVVTETYSDPSPSEAKLRHTIQQAGGV